MSVRLHEAFLSLGDEFLHFERINEPAHRRRDICAFIVLDALVPGKPGRPIVSAAEHDEFFLDVDCDKLAEVATDDDLKTLARCGVRYSASLDCLCMFA